MAGVWIYLLNVGFLPGFAGIYFISVLQDVLWFEYVHVVKLSVLGALVVKNTFESALNIEYPSFPLFLCLKPKPQRHERRNPIRA